MQNISNAKESLKFSSGCVKVANFQEIYGAFTDVQCNHGRNGTLGWHTHTLRAGQSKAGQVRAGQGRAGQSIVQMSIKVLSQPSCNVLETAHKAVHQRIHSCLSYIKQSDISLQNVTQSGEA